MNNQSLEYHPQPKFRRYHPLLPKHFRMDNLVTEPSEPLNHALLLSPTEHSSSPQPLTERHSTSRTHSLESLETRRRNLEVQRSKLFNELHQFEDQHLKKDSIRARLSSLRTHLERLQGMSKQAKLMMTFESTLLDRINGELANLKKPVKVSKFEENEKMDAKKRTEKLMVCMNVDGVLGIVEVGQEITVHLSQIRQKCSIPTPRHISKMKDLPEIVDALHKHLRLKNNSGSINLHYQAELNEKETSLSLALQGYPYPLVSLLLKETNESDILIEAQDTDMHMSLTLPASRLNIHSHLHELSRSDLHRLHKVLQGNLMTQRKSGVYSLIYKSYSYHLGRFISKAIPRHGELFSMRVLPPGSEFRNCKHEYAIAEVHLQAREDAVRITLGIDILTELLRLEFGWGQNLVCLREEDDARLFAFLRGLQFLAPRHSPITFLTSLEVLSSIKPQLASVISSVST